MGTPHDTPLIDRFMARVLVDISGCWLWTAGTNSGGYGRFAVSHALNVAAHRWSYEHHIGPIPSGATIDHLCRVRRCVNPLHLEAVTLRENLMRGDTPAARNAAKISCPQGHPYDMIYKSGQRGCRRCNAAKAKRSRERRAAI